MKRKNLVGMRFSNPANNGEIEGIEFQKVGKEGLVGIEEEKNGEQEFL